VSARPANPHGDDAVTDASELHTYIELYRQWEQQQWSVAELDFSQDRDDWESLDDAGRWMRLYGLAAFFIGEQRVASELGPILRAAPREEMRIVLSTQIADEARHVVFFDRVWEELGLSTGESLDQRAAELDDRMDANFAKLFDEVLERPIERLMAAPDDEEALAAAIAINHIVVEGMVGLTGQEVITAFNEREGTLPGFMRGLRLVSRDEHRHVAFGVRFLADLVKSEPDTARVIRRSVEEALPAATALVAGPAGLPKYEDVEIMGTTGAQMREMALAALQRRLAAIGA
jgi:ribonucleoside-diphosphate reductase beta chain